MSGIDTLIAASAKVKGSGATGAGFMASPDGPTLIEDVIRAQAELMGLLSPVYKVLENTADRVLGPQPPSPEQGNPSNMPPVRVADGSLGYAMQQFFELERLVLNISVQTNRLSKI